MHRTPVRKLGPLLATAVLGVGGCFADIQVDIQADDFGNDEETGADDSDCPIGEYGCTCDPMGVCLPGLSCQGGVCVDLQDGVCGDGVIGGGEQCDPGPMMITPECDWDCTYPICGDGLVNPTAGEQCDDGNVVDGDGCDANCQSGPLGGQEMWSHIWESGGGADLGEGVAIGIDGEAIVAGSITSSNGSLWRVDENGVLGPPQGCGCVPWNYYLAVDAHVMTGSVAVGARAYDGNFNDPALRIFDGNGMQTAYVTYPAVDAFAQEQSTRGVAFMDDGTVIAAGWLFNGVDQDIYLGRFQLDGTEVFSGPSVDTGTDETAWDIEALPSGEFIIVGSVGPLGARDVLLRRYDPMGNVIFSETYDLGGDDVGQAIGLFHQDDLPGGIVGWTDMGGEIDAFALRVGPMGEQELHMFYGNPGGEDRFWDIEVVDAQQMYVGGWFWNGANTDGIVWRVDEFAAIDWEVEIDFGGDDQVRGLASDGTRVVATGFVTGPVDQDMWVAQYTP